MMEPGAEAAARPAVAADYDGRGLANLGATACRLLVGDGEGLLPDLADDVLPAALTEGVECAVILLADGLGYRQLLGDAEAGGAPNPARLLDAARRGPTPPAHLTTVVPSAPMAA